MIYIKGLALDEMLFRLWDRAKYMPLFAKMANKPRATLKDCQLCINQLMDEPFINITSFFGKKLYLEFDTEYLDHEEYNYVNANGMPLAESIIRGMKMNELSKAAALFIANHSILEKHADSILEKHTDSILEKHADSSIVQHSKARADNYNLEVRAAKK